MFYIPIGLPLYPKDECVEFKKKSFKKNEVKQQVI